MTARSYRDCHLLGMRNITRNFLGVRFHCHLLGYFRSEAVDHFVNNGFRSCETLNLYISSGIWGPTRHLSLKITNTGTLVIFRLRKPLNQVGRPQDLNPRPPKCESRALPRSHLAHKDCLRYTVTKFLIK